MAVANTQAYHVTATITTVKGFIVQAILSRGFKGEKANTALLMDISNTLIFLSLIKQFPIILLDAIVITLLELL